MTSAILVRGEPVHCAAEVRHDPALQFRALGKRRETRAVVWHWTGGEGGGSQVFSVLQERALSVHFTIDQAGVVWQYCDADAFCAHARGANAWSVGVEISNRANATAEHPKWPRSVALDTIHGRTARHTRFLPAQIEAAKALADALARAYGLPHAVPRAASGDVIARTLRLAELEGYRGHLGHYHLSAAKRDPGTELLRELARLGERGTVA